MPDAEYKRRTISFRGGDGFCFVSDGLFEFMNQEILSARDADGVLEQLIDCSKRARRTDDAPAVCIRIK